MTVQIYVASLSDYNAGRLHGVWIELEEDTTADDIGEAVQEMLDLSPCRELGDLPAEEWAIHDHEGFGDLNVSEYESFERLAEWGRAIAEYGDAFSAYVSHVGQDYADVEGFRDAYQGEWSSLADYAQQLAEDVAYDGAAYVSDISSRWPFTCIDWHRAGRELEMGGDISTADAGGGSVYIFRNY